MPFKTHNTYKVTFKDGTSFESSGSASSDYKDMTVQNEFYWVSFHISKEVLHFGKQETDIAKIEFTLTADLIQKV